MQYVTHKMKQSKQRITQKLGQNLVFCLLKFYTMYVALSWHIIYWSNWSWEAHKTTDCAI